MTATFRKLEEIDTKYPSYFNKNARDLLNGDKPNFGEIAIPKKECGFLSSE